MSTAISSSELTPSPDTRRLLIKWVVALLVPVLVFALWSGESIINAVISPGTVSGNVPTDPVALIEAAIFTAAFYIAVFLLAGYLVAADSGRRSMIEMWLDVLIFALVPLILVILFGLIDGLALCAVVWPAYLYGRALVRKARHYTPPPPLESLKVMDDEQRAALMSCATAGGLWFGIAFAAISLIVDLIYFFTGTLPVILLIWALVRTLILPVAGYFLGRLAGVIALRRALPQRENGNGGNGAGRIRNRLSRRQQLEVLSTTRAREEAKDLVPNDLPLRSTGAQRFYVILALGLNIVVGFAGLLDLGYVAFFAIGSYAWGLIGSTQLGFITGIHVNPQIWPWFFWPMVLGAALIAASRVVLLGAPTLRLRGDYLAIVTLGFGEIVPIVFLEMD